MKLIDLRDSTGSGDVDISTVIKGTTDDRGETFVQGLSGRKLKVRCVFLFSLLLILMDHFD